MGAGLPVLDKPGGIGGGGKAGRFTSPASKLCRKAFPQKTLPNPIARVVGTRVVGGALGRAVPYAGWGLIAHDGARLIGSLPEPPDDQRGNKSNFCFRGDTLVWGIAGNKRIDEVSKGDMIKAWDVQQKQLVLTAVLDVQQHTGEFPINELVSSDDDRIYVTDGHPLLGNGIWVHSHEVSTIPIWSCKSSGLVRVSSKPVDSAHFTVYHLVTKTGTYLVGSSGLVASGQVSAARISESKQ